MILQKTSNRISISTAPLHLWCRLSTLKLLDDLLEDVSLNSAFGSGCAQRTVGQLLLPGIVWRPGKTAASIRFSAVTALATFFAMDLIDSRAMMELLEAGEILPLLFQVLEEDHYADTRISGCYVASRIILSAGASSVL